MSSDSGLRGVAVASAGVLVLRAGAFGWALAWSLLLARQLGADGLGVYMWAFAWAATLQVVATVGLDRLATRELAIATELDDPAAARGLLRGALRLGAGISLAVLAVGVLAGALLLDGQRRTAFVIGLALVGPLALMTIVAGGVQGLGFASRSRLPDDLVRPVAFIVLLLLAWLPGVLPSEPAVALALQLVATALALAVAAWLLRRRMSTAGERQDRPVGSLLRDALPLGLVGGAAILMGQLDVIMLGLLAPDDEVGVYSIAMRLAQIVALAEFAVNAAALPAIARLFARDDSGSLRRTASVAALGALGAAVVLALPLLVLPAPFLGLFGPDFAGGEFQVRVLALSFVLSAAAGLNGGVLIMTRHGGLVAAGTLAAVGVNAALNAVLIPRSGGDGAAIAWIVSVVVWNGILAVLVRRSLGYFVLPRWLRA